MKVRKLSLTLQILLINVAILLVTTIVLGTTLKSEINRIRLNEAVRLISNTDLPVWAIAEKCGFCCASHLNTRFKAMFGYTPSVFRYQNPR